MAWLRSLKVDIVSPFAFVLIASVFITGLNIQEVLYLHVYFRSPPCLMKNGIRIH